MPTVSFTISSADLQHMVTAFCSVHGWTAESGSSQAEFARQKVMRYVQDVVASYDRQQAEAAAKAALPPPVSLS